MVAKATQNLFDVTVGGAGFHVTAHLIALVALFIACFAIAGYISYRGDSIPASALKDQDADFEQVTLDGITWGDDKRSGGAQKTVHVVGFTPTSFLTGAPNSVHALTTAPGVASSQDNRVYIPSNAAITRATLLTVAPTPVTVTSVDMGLAARTTATTPATLPGNGTITGIFNTATGVAAGAGAGAEVTVSVDALAPGTAGQSGVGSGSNGSDVFIEINGGTNVSGSLRVDIWYSLREL